MMTSNNLFGQFGDTTLTKVFVGGLAWETPKEALNDHFHNYGEILEAVIISDKITGRSKGYGFVSWPDHIYIYIDVPFVVVWCLLIIVSRWF